MKTNIIYAFRNILKNKTNSSITIIGLSVAIACCIVIFLFVSQEFSMNNFHDKLDRIYRLHQKIGYTQGTDYNVLFNAEIADKIKEEIPQVESCTEYRNPGEVVSFYDNTYYDIELSFVDKDFFNIFGFNLIAGDESTLFDSPNEIVLTRSCAERYLSDGETLSNMLGKTIEFPLGFGDRQFEVTGIFEDIPRNSSIDFEAIIPAEQRRTFGGCDTRFGYTSIFYLLRNDANRPAVESNIISLLKKEYNGLVTRMQNENNLVKTDDAYSPYILPFQECYFHNQVWSCYEDYSNKRNSIVLLSIGLVILLIACSNYTILSLGQYLKKVGDVGVRKSMGANKKDIFNVFFSEGIILTASSFSIGILLAVLIIPLFGRLAQAEIHTELINYSQLVTAVLSSFLLIVVLTSLVPVLVFSKVSPNQMGSNKLNVGKKSYLSQVFVSVQYSISIILVIVTIFIVRQSNFLKEKDLGVNTNNILDIGISRIENDKRRLFGNMLLEHPGVINNTLVSRNFANGNSNTQVPKGDGENILVRRFKVDHNYISTLELELVLGENFTEKNVSRNDRTMIVNEEFVKQFAIEDSPLGRTYGLLGTRFRIIGVVKDYHFSDVTQRIVPAMHFTRLNAGNGYYRSLLRFHPNQISEVQKHIEECYEKVAPGKSLNYHFWDERLADRYREEERWSKIIGYAAGIAILISSLGLFGLTILLVNQRIKEIGVRKVNGARSYEVLLNINKSFVIWLFSSLLVAAPVAFFIVNSWMADFPFKVDISWWVFVLSGTISFFIALLTVSYHSLMASGRNPIEALRYE